MEHVNMETGASKDPQLYQLDYDIGQQRNVAWERPQMTAAMESRIQEILKSKRTR